MHLASKIIVKIIAYVLLILFLIPIFWMLLIALKPENTTGLNLTDWLKPPFTLDNFSRVIHSKNANIGLWILNSFIVSTFSTIGVLLLSTLAGFAFSRMRFFGRNILFYLIMAGLMVPREATLIPLYTLFRDMGLLNTHFSLIAPTIAAPIGIIIMKQFFDGLPEELFEAAKLDGCGWYRTLFTIAVPLCKPALASLGIFIFLQAWNDFLWPFISVTDPNIMTIPIGLPVFKSQYMTAQSLPMAASALTAIPILIVFIIFQKHIVKGISFTGGK